MGFLSFSISILKVSIRLMRKSKLRNNVGIFLEKSTSKDPIRNYRTVKWYSGWDEKTGVELYTIRKSDYM